MAVTTAVATAVATGAKRNVIVLGKTGCGKSTLANKIICAIEKLDEEDNEEDSEVDDEEKDKLSEPFDVAESFHAVTTSIQGTVVNVDIGGLTYNINMIDTIGFSDTRGSKIMSDKKIMLSIKQHMRVRAQEGLSLIIFVFRKGRFTEEEKSVFELVYKHFTDDIKQLSCLVITGCEGLNKKARKELITNFKTDSLTAKFATIMTKGIFTVGLPRISTMSKRLKDATIEEMKDDVAPIHKVIAEAHLFHLHDEIQKESFWEKLSSCTIL